MKKAILGLILCAVFGLGALTASSAMAVNGQARVIGGDGTVASPLRIEVSGEVGLTGLIDSLLPFRGLPTVQIEYKELEFAIPGLNPLFEGRPWLALSLLCLSLAGGMAVLAWWVMAILGLKIVRR